MTEQTSSVVLKATGHIRFFERFLPPGTLFEVDNIDAQRFVRSGIAIVATPAEAAKASVAVARTIAAD